MSELSFFKPNKKNTGFHFKFNIGFSKNKTGGFEDLCMYVQATRQFSWDEKARQGSFKKNFNNPEKNVSIKMNFTECMEIVSLIDKLKSFSPSSAKYVLYAFGDKCDFYKAKFYHSWSGGSTTINISPSIRDGMFFPDGVFFSLTRDGNDRFSVKLLWGELEELKALIIWGLNANFQRRREFVRSLESKRPITQQSEEREVYEEHEVGPDVVLEADEEFNNPFLGDDD